jgi:hypothetical protein
VAKIREKIEESKEKKRQKREEREEKEARISHEVTRSLMESQTGHDNARHGNLGDMMVDQ